MSRALTAIADFWYSRSGRVRLIIVATILVIVSAVGVFSYDFLFAKDETEGPVPSVSVAASRPAANSSGMTVEQQVAATLAATVPTPLPTATPDIPATLQAERELARAAVHRVVEVNPLVSNGQRNPYLSTADVVYLSALGDVMWQLTGTWLHLRRVLSVPTEDWTTESIGLDVALAAQDVATATALTEEITARDLSEGLTREVAAYTQSFQAGVLSLLKAQAEISKALPVLEGKTLDQLTFEEREALRQIRHIAEQGVSDYAQAMSDYGCSICGELYRFHAR